MENVYLWVFVFLSVGLLFVNVYQYLIQRSALRIAEILYIMSRTVRQRAADVRKSQKDVEIIEAHLFDLTTSARSLLRSLGRSEASLGPDPEHTMSPNGHHMDSDSLIRLADNIFYAVREESPQGTWEELSNKALERFQNKVPSMEREGAKKIVNAVAMQFRQRTAEQNLAASVNR